MNKSLKQKPLKSISHHHKNHFIKEQKNIDIPTTQLHKLKIHKSSRPFGKDITNTFKQKYSNLALNSNITNKVNYSLPKVSSIQSIKNNNSSKMSSTANTRKNNTGFNSTNNNNTKSGTPYEYNNNYNYNLTKNKIKSTFTQAKVNNSNNAIIPNIKPTMTNSYIKNNENINISNNINSFKSKKFKEKNKDLINRLKNKTSALKFSITSKNYYINFKNSKHQNQNVKSFELYEEPKTKNINKNIENKDITKGINILGKFDSYLHDNKFPQKVKAKFHKTTYNYYFDKSKNVKNTKSSPNEIIKKDKNDNNNIINKDKVKDPIIGNKNENNNNDNIVNKDKDKNKDDNKNINNIIIENKNELKEEKKPLEKSSNDNDDKKEIKNNPIIEESNKEKEKNKTITSNQSNSNISKEKEKESQKEKEKQKSSGEKDSKKETETKYKSPLRKSRSKKKKKHQKELSSQTPIEINCKPLSPKNHSSASKSKDEEDFIPKYFNSCSISNVQIPKEYLNVIYYNLLIEEYNNMKKFKPEYNYMNSQSEINEQMRSILIDWIIDVHGKFGFTDETLYMTVLIIDRYSSLKKITRNEYQNLGISALMISCKHEEINVPKVEDFIYITDNAYNKEEVFTMEQNILNGLNYDLLYPSPIKFFEYLALKFNFDKKQLYFGKYLMENFLLNLIWIKYKPSIIACASAYIVMKFFKLKNYRDSYQKQWYMIEGKEGYNKIENNCGVKDCAQEICNFVDNIGSTNYLSCQKKYSSDEFCNISKLIMNYPKNDEKKK